MDGIHVIKLKYNRPTSQLIWVKQKVYVDAQLPKELSNPYCDVQ